MDHRPSSRLRVADTSTNDLFYNVFTGTCDGLAVSQCYGAFTNDDIFIQLAPNTTYFILAGMQTIKRGTKEPDHDLAHSIIERCYHKGLLFFAPVGAWGQTVKISPPLTIPLEALQEGLQVLSEATDEAVDVLEPAAAVAAR